MSHVTFFEKALSIAFEGCRPGSNFGITRLPMNAIRLLVASFIVIVLTAAPARALPIFGINNANNNLVRFESAAPGTIVSTIPITGMIASDTIVGLDFRPVDGKLFGLGSGSRLYIIDPATGVATQVGSGTFSVPLSGTAFGFDFNPVTDRLRVVSDTNQNLRLDPNTGAITAIDTNVAYVAGDPNAAANPDVTGLAYTDNSASATTSTLFGIDATANTLVRVGGTNGSPSANAGQLTTIGALGVDPTATLGFDITGTTTAFATMVVAGVPRLYVINLTSGAATLVGNIGGPTTVRAMTVAISSFTAALVGTTATFTGSVGANSIVFDQSGGLLRHNRFSNGDA